MTEIMPVPRNSHITVLRPPSIPSGAFLMPLLSGFRRQALIELHLPVEAGGQLRRGKAADGCAVNLPCAKVLPHAKRLYGANAPPARRPDLPSCKYPDGSGISRRRKVRFALMPIYTCGKKDAIRARSLALPIHLSPTALGPQWDIILGG